jgi:hypothetical protein
MNTKPLHILLILTALCISSTFAADSTVVKKPLFMSIHAGYIGSSVYGTMVDYNNEDDGAGQIKNIGNFQFNFQLEKKLSDYFYIKSGISYLKKESNPQENTNFYYPDALKTDYLSIPFIAGLNVIAPENKTLHLSLELGPSVNFRLKDKSNFGPDRAEARTAFASISVNPGVRLSYASEPKLKIIAHYSYLYDVSNSYVETLYYGSPDQPLRKFAYRYKASSLTLGFQWPIN